MSSEVPKPSGLDHEPLSLRWLKYRYTGNFAGNILFNSGIFDQLVGVIGEPSKPFIVETGNERIEGFHLILDMEGGWPITFGFPEWKQASAFKERDDAAVLTINPQVIDGRVQIAQRHEDFSSIEYERRFVRILGKAIVMGIGMWAWTEQGEKLKGKSLWERFKARRGLKRFWDQKGRGVVMGITRTGIPSLPGL